MTEAVGTLPIGDDTENCDVPVDTEEDELEIAGGIPPAAQEELVLEGDIRYPAEDDEAQP